MTYELLTPLLDKGIRTTHFFNGRLLYAQDLQNEQSANRKQRAQLGRAIGTGVVYGLEVSLGTAKGDRPSVKITSGLALNRQGHPLVVPDDLEEVEVALVRDEDETTTEAGLFATCKPPKTTMIPTNTGVYVLVMSPASGFKEDAPKVGLSDNGVGKGCGSKYAVEGVQFRLVELDVFNDAIVPIAIRDDLRTLTSATSRTISQDSILRNLVANWCLGTADVRSLIEDAYALLKGDTTELSYGPLDQMRADASLSECDVPLALLFWTGDGIEFVDTWSVRRRVHHTSVSAHAATTMDRRRAETEARLLQFEEQVAYLTRSGLSQFDISRVRLSTYFRFLPAVGAVPERVGSGRGFTHLELFDGLTFREPVFIEGTGLRELFRKGLDYEAIDLTKNELIWLYRVRQNRHDAASAVQPYLIFASGHIPYVGDAQFDLARWNYSNYGPGVSGAVLARDGGELAGSVITASGSALSGSIITGG